MQAVIMAGGKGTRIAAMNSEVPKPMIVINGRPVLEYMIEGLAGQEIRDIILVVGYKKEIIKNWFRTGEKWGVSIRYIEEETPLGTAGALYFLKNICYSDFFLLNGDILMDIDLRRFMGFHLTHRAKASIFVHPNNHPFDSSVITIGEDERVTGWYNREKLPQWYQNRVNAGIHILSPEVLCLIEDCRKRSLDKDILAPLIKEGELYAYSSPEYVKDMGTPERFQVVESDLINGRVQIRNLQHWQKAVFLDRDGTINKYVGFLTNMADFELLEGVAEGIKLLNENGYLVIVVTNQPVIARGETTWEQLRLIHDKMETLLGQKGAYVDDIFVCPHHPDKGFKGERVKYKIVCDCRKPKPGLLLQAAEKYNIDFSQSYMIGDSERDIQAGEAVGCRVFKVTTSQSLFEIIKNNIV